MKRRFRNQLAAKRGTHPLVWVGVGVGGCLCALVLFVALAGGGLRGDYVVESYGLWDYKTKTYEPIDAWVGKPATFTASTFEGLGVRARYESLGDGRIQVGGAIWSTSWQGGRLVIVNGGDQYVLRRR